MLFLNVLNILKGISIGIISLIHIYVLLLSLLTLLGLRLQGILNFPSHGPRTPFSFSPQG